MPSFFGSLGTPNVCILFFLRWVEYYPGSRFAHILSPRMTASGWIDHSHTTSYPVIVMRDAITTDGPHFFGTRLLKRQYDVTTTLRQRGTKFRTPLHELV